MSIFSRNIQLLLYLIFFSLSSAFPQIFNSENIQVHCTQTIMLACLQDFKLLVQPKEYAEYLIGQVFQQPIIDFIIKSIKEKSVYEKINSHDLCSVISDTIYQIKAFVPCPQKIQTIVQRMENQNGNVCFQPIDYQVVDAAWFVVNAIMIIHLQSWDYCYDTVMVFRKSFKVSMYLTLEDAEFDNFWKNCLQRPEVIALIEEEYLYQMCGSDGIFSQRMLDLYACIIYILQVPGLQHWSTLFPPKTLQKIICNWISIHPQNIHRIPILSLLMNMFAYGWVWRTDYCCNNIVINKQFRSAMKEVLKPVQKKPHIPKKTKKRKK